MGVKLVSHTNGRTYAENCTLWGSDEGIWAEERGITGNKTEWHSEVRLGLHCTKNAIWVNRSEIEIGGA
jgi:hypothetical protein